MARFLWCHPLSPSLVGDFVICLDPTDSDLGAGILEFRAPVDEPLEMGVQADMHHQEGGGCALCFYVVEVNGCS